MSDSVHNTNKKAITVIIPCHNCADSLADTWRSLTEQTFGLDRLECIFVDDASTDEGATWNMLQDIEKEASESVMIIRLEENLRQGGARNVAITYASGEYIMFLDADDELMPGACEILYNTAIKEDSDIIQFNHLAVCGNDSREMRGTEHNVTYAIDSVSARNRFLNASTVDYGCWNKFYKTELVRMAEAKFAEHAVYEEPLFVYPCFLYADRITLITDVLYRYNLHPGSTVTSHIGTRLLDHPRVQLELLEYCMKHTEKWAEYRETICLYFMWSYYCETICFAGSTPGARLPLEYFREMQNVCRTVFPDWAQMEVFTQIPAPVVEVIGSISRDFGSQAELDEYIRQVSRTI